MPRRKNPVPSYTLHRPSGQAYVRIPDGAGGRTTVYLGAYDILSRSAEVLSQDVPQPEVVRVDPGGLQRPPG